MARNASHFTKGQSTYICRCCGLKTRQTGRGDNDNVNLCANCYDLAGEENHLSDTGELYESPANVLAMIAAVAAKGDATCWNKLKTAATIAQVSAAAAKQSVQEQLEAIDKAFPAALGPNVPAGPSPGSLTVYQTVVLKVLHTLLEKVLEVPGVATHQVDEDLLVELEALITSATHR